MSLWVLGALCSRQSASGFGALCRVVCARPRRFATSGQRVGLGGLFHYLPLSRSSLPPVLQLEVQVGEVRDQRQDSDAKRHQRHRIRAGSGFGLLSDGDKYCKCE